MLNLDELEAESGVERKNTKERLKEEKALRAKQLEEETKYNVRKGKFDQECLYEASCRVLVREIYDKLGYQMKWPLVQAQAKQLRGSFELLLDLKDRRIRILEDTIRGRDLRSDLLKAMHVEAFNRMIKRHEANIDTLTEDFLKAKNKMMAERRAFLQTALLKGKQLRDEIRLASYASDKGEEIQKLIQRHESELADFNEMHNRRFEEFYKDYEKRIMDKWIDFKNVFENYKKEANILRRNIYIAKESDDRENEEILRLKRMKMRLERQFEASKSLIDSGLERHMLELEKKAGGLEGCLKSMQRTQRECGSQDDRTREELSMVTDRVERELRAVLRLGEKVVRLRRACNSLETGEELAPAGELPLKETEVPCPGALELGAARVEAQTAYMSAKLSEMRQEEARLRAQLREVLAVMERLEDRARLAGRLHQLGVPPAK